MQCGPDGVDIFDVTDPARPVLLGRFTEKGPAHELQEVDGVLYGAFCRGFCAVDVRDPARPVLLGCGDQGWHSAFRHPSRPLVFTTNESIERPNAVLVWDVSSLTSPLQVSEFSPSPVGIAHQVWVRNDLLYVANYVRGVTVADISNPASPRLVGFYDTFHGSDKGFRGVWGVVAGEDGLIYASDTDSGLWIFALE
jgi:hypothetical protein